MSQIVEVKQTYDNFYNNVSVHDAIVYNEATALLVAIIIILEYDINFNSAGRAATFVGS